MNGTLFSGRASAYETGRSGYPQALLDHLYGAEGLSPASVVADVGAGTGKLTRELLARGSTVYAVEPDAGMLARARAALSDYPRFFPVAATAEHTTLADASVDWVTCASAFHWLDAPAFAAECRRILRPQGRVLLLWLVRDAEDPFNRAHAAVLAAHCPGFTGLSHGHDACAPHLNRFFRGSFSALRFDASVLQGREAFVQRSLSSSYAPRPGQPEYGPLISALEALFEAHQQEGQVLVRTSCAAYLGCV